MNANDAALFAFFGIPITMCIHIIGVVLGFWPNTYQVTYSAPLFCAMVLFFALLIPNQ